MFKFDFKNNKMELSIDFEEIEKNIKEIVTFLDETITNLTNEKEEQRINKETIIENEYIKITKIEKPKHVVLYINYINDILTQDILKNIEFYTNTKDNKLLSIEANYKSMLKFIIDSKDISQELLNPSSIEIKYRPNSKTHRIFIKKF